MQERVNALWGHFKANRAIFAIVTLLTLGVGILIGTVVSVGVKGQERRSADATPLTVPSPKQMSNQFSQIAKTLEPAVVNINTESTIKPTARRRGQAPGGDEEGGENPFGDFRERSSLSALPVPSAISSTNSSGIPTTRVQFASVRWAQVC